MDHHWPNEQSRCQWSGSHTKNSKMVLDVALFNRQHYKVTMKGKVEQSREWISALPYILI